MCDARARATEGDAMTRPDRWAIGYSWLQLTARAIEGASIGRFDGC